MDITHDNVCSSMLSCFYSHLLSTGRPISSLKMPFYPLKAKDICNIYTHKLNITSTVYTLLFCFLFNIFFNVQFMK